MYASIMRPRGCDLRGLVMNLVCFSAMLRHGEGLSVRECVSVKLIRQPIDSNNHKGVCRSPGDR